MNIDRLISVFKSSKNDFDNVEDESLHWLGFHIENKDNFSKHSSIENFRKTLSLGRDDSMFRKSYLNLAEISEWSNELSEKNLINNLSSHNIGNSDDVVLHRSKYYDYNKFFQIYYFNLIKDFISNHNICFEIGAGYGALAEIIIKNKNTKYFVVDLPESNILTAYYLNKCFPDKKIYLYDNYINNNRIVMSSDIEEFDIFILPPNLKFEDSINFDLFINARSMMEMDMATINDYFNFIHKHSNEGTYFLNVNRYEKVTVGESIRFSDYPYDPNWDVEISTPAFKQEHIHLILAKRKNNEGNIHKELIAIDKLGEEFYEKGFSFSRFKFLIQKLILDIFGRKFLTSIIQVKRKLQGR